MKYFAWFFSAAFFAIALIKMYHWLPLQGNTDAAVYLAFASVFAFIGNALSRIDELK